MAIKENSEPFAVWPVISATEGHAVLSYEPLKKGVGDTVPALADRYQQDLAMSAHESP
jgi:hypothetical protein